MENYKQEFIKLSLDIGALRFGEFKLKSGRVSPFFFNMGIFSSGRLIKKVGDLILFPNYLMHTAYPFKQEGERRSFSFNLEVDKKISNIFND